MHDPCRNGAPRTVGRSLATGVALSCLGLGLSCGSGGGGGSGYQGPLGAELPKPGGGTYFLDPHQGGRASRMRLPEVFQGRLVDVHGLATDGSTDPEPVHRDLLVRDTLQSDASDYELQVNPITQRTRLIVRRVRGAPDSGSGTFEELVARARANLLPVLPQGESGGNGVLSLVPRNAALALRFDDLLQDDAESTAALVDVVRLASGYPPDTPLLARILFDPNFGGVSRDAFHSTRVLIDFAVTAQESADSPFEVPVNALGLPASLPNDARANVSVRLPTRLAPERGVFRLLTNLAGGALDRRDDGPVDPEDGDLVRAFRSGRGDDGNNGFLLDLNPPELIGAWPVSVSSAFPDPSGPSGRQWVLDLVFTTVCRRALAPGDVLSLGSYQLEPVEPSNEPDSEGRVENARVRLLNDEPLTGGGALLGSGLFQATYANSGAFPSGCWISFSPPAGEPPTSGIAPESQVLLRFSEPMDPGSLDPFDTARLGRGGGADPILPSSIVVSDVVASPDLRQFRVRPLLPLAYATSGEYHFDLAAVAGVTDLAGNALAGAPGPIPVHLDPAAERFENGGVVQRFGAIDELEPIGKDDLRGQVFYDLARGVIRGRSPSSDSFPADQSNPVPSIMIPFLPGVQTPLSGLGSKLQAVWRYCDLGWFVEDESKHNLDVVGLNWAPSGGTVLSDFFERFEIRLAHSRRLPDEARVFTGTFYPCSGLGAGARICTPCRTFVPYEDNILVDPRSPQLTVHDRSLGYRITASDLFLGVSGMPLVPFPMNRGNGAFKSFTWRDTAVLAKDGEESGGIPLKIEVTPPLDIVPGPAGRIAGPGSVPAWGLPLLMEFRCYPSTNALGLNPLSIYLAQNAQQLPCFRAFSTGGLDEGGQKVLVDPDLAIFPEGGFNPGSRPPGKPTAFQADNSFYVGQLDTVVRVSRCHVIWFDSGLLDPRYHAPVVSPKPEDQPAGTRIELEFRGATGFLPSAGERPFDSRALDPLGDLEPGEVLFLDGDGSWTSDITRLAGARYLQTRISFVNNLEAGIFPELSAIGLAFEAR